MHYAHLKFIFEFIKNVFDVLLSNKNFFFEIYEFFDDNKDKDIYFFVNSIEFIYIIKKIDNKNNKGDK
jgi:hypothetical protein